MTVRAKYLRIPEKKWSAYQHYQDKAKDPDWTPPWIKLYVKLLDDFDFRHLPAEAKWPYVGLLLIASETHNVIPSGALFLCKRLAISEKETGKAITNLIENGLIEPCTEAQSRVALDSSYSLRKEVRSKSKDKGLSTVPRDVAETALENINKKLRGAA